MTSARRVESSAAAVASGGSHHLYFRLDIRRAVSPQQLAPMATPKEHQTFPLFKDSKAPRHPQVSGLFCMIQIESLLRRSHRKKPLWRNINLFLRIVCLAEQHGCRLRIDRVRPASALNLLPLPIFLRCTGRAWTASIATVHSRPQRLRASKVVRDPHQNNRSYKKGPMLCRELPKNAIKFSSVNQMYGLILSVDFFLVSNPRFSASLLLDATLIVFGA